MKYLQALIALFDHYVNDNGEMLYPSYFVDWPTKDTEDELTGSRFIHIIAVDKAKKLLENFRLDIELCEKLKTKLLKGNLFVIKMKQVIALKYFYKRFRQRDLILCKQYSHAVFLRSSIKWFCTILY